MINNYFISIIIKDKKKREDICNILENKLDLSLQIFNSIDELKKPCFNSLTLIITDLDINKFSEFIGIKIIKLSTEINTEIIENIKKELIQVEKLETTLKRVVKENSLKLELFSNKFNIENLDNFIFQILNKFLLSLNFEVKYSIVIILKEAITNAFYHGNFNIDSKIKSEENGFEKFNNIILKKQKQKQYNSKKVYIEIMRKTDKVILSIEDEGNGFNHKKNTSLERESYGRGIKLIKINSDSIKWNNKGNKVIIEKKING